MTAQNSSLFLASSSPRRRELLEQLGLTFEVLILDEDESILPEEEPKDYVLRLSKLKAEAGLSLLSSEESRPVLGADTIVVIGEKILGKPENQNHAAQMLKLLSGKTHQVFTAVTLTTHLKTESIISTTNVQFKALSSEEIQTYWQSGEPIGKAGGYAIQGLGAVFVERVEGSYTGVVGLPLFETNHLLNVFGVNTQL